MMCYAAYQSKILPRSPQKSPWQYFDRKVLFVIKFQKKFSKEKDRKSLFDTCLSEAFHYL